MEEDTNCLSPNSRKTDGLPWPGWAMDEGGVERRQWEQAVFILFLIQECSKHLLYVTRCYALKSSQYRDKHLLFLESSLHY